MQGVTSSSLVVSTTKGHVFRVLFAFLLNLTEKQAQPSSRACFFFYSAFAYASNSFLRFASNDFLVDSKELISFFDEPIAYPDR